MKEENMKISYNKVDMLEMIRKIRNLIKKCSRLKTNSSRKDNDIRKDIYTYLMQELQSLMCGIELSLSLQDDSFYYRWEGKTLDKKQMEDCQCLFLDFLFNGFYFLFFVRVENYLRLIANSNDINKEEFSIMKTFENLVNECKLSKGDENLFSIFSELRNLSHNGGFYSKENNKSIEFKGYKFIFEKGNSTKLPFSMIESNIFIAEHIIDLIEKINQKTEKIDYIEDNYAKIEFTYE